MKDETELRLSGFNLSGSIRSPFVSLSPCGATSDVGLGGQLLCRFAVHLRSSAPRSDLVATGPCCIVLGFKGSGTPVSSIGDWQSRHRRVNLPLNPPLNPPVNLRWKL
jgi:hypothetical protein